MIRKKRCYKYRTYLSENTEYEFRFIVDGEFQVTAKRPQRLNKEGNLVNYIDTADVIKVRQTNQERIQTRKQRKLAHSTYEVRNSNTKASKYRLKSRAGSEDLADLDAS